MYLQALILLIVYVLCLIVALISSITYKQFNVYTGISLLFTLLFVILLTYDTNCLTAGNCGTWSWIRTVLYVILPIIFLIMTLISFSQGAASKADEAKKA